MEHIIVFAVALLLGCCIGWDIAVLRTNRKHEAVNDEFERIVLDEQRRLEAERDDYRDNPRAVAMSGVAQRGSLS
jgi:hypothetical protein